MSDSATTSPLEAGREGRGVGLTKALAAVGPRRLSAGYLWVAFTVAFAIIAPDTFLTSTTFKVVLGEGVITCLLALAFLVPLAAGIYDLAVGANMSLALVICVYLTMNTGVPPVVSSLLGIGACLVSGFVSGFIVVRMGVNSFIATLGTSQVLLAAALLISNNRQLVAVFPEYWSNIGIRSVGGVPVLVFGLVAVAIVIWYVFEFTSTGRYLFATGGNPDAARLAGVRTDLVLWGSLVASGAIAGIAGVAFSMRSGVYATTTGPGYLFPAIAAVFLGASQLSQRPNVWGTLIAYFALAFGIQGLVLSASGSSIWIQPLFQGVSLIVAVAIAARPVVIRSRRLRSTQRADRT